MTEKTLEQRIQVLEDIEAIKQLKHRYFLCCDRKQPAAVRDCFVDGPMTIDYGRIGVFDNADAMVEVFAQLACQEHIVEMHHAQNPQIGLTSPTTAKATWGLYYYMINTDEDSVTQLGGYYDDEYVKVDGHWKISATRYAVTSTVLLSTASDSVRSIFAGRTAPTAIDDPSRQAK